VVIGAGSLIGVRPPENFHLPFLAPNISQFWLRVHRTLTTWLTDYVFTPLYSGGLRRFGGKRRLWILSGALLATMTVAGVWHGTTWRWLLFGIVHGVLLVGHRLYEAAMQSWLGSRRLAALRARWHYRGAAVALTLSVTAPTYLLFFLEEPRLLILARRLAEFLGWLG
jgi:D-alanyl-lipoteichoic acid acyltransferase DltB (MBOAT superfamily)